MKYLYSFLLNYFIAISLKFATSKLIHHVILNPSKASQLLIDTLSVNYGILIHHSPSFQRAPLEQVVLRVKLLDLGSPKSILSLALQPPDVRDIEKTILILKEVSVRFRDVEQSYSKFVRKK